MGSIKKLISLFEIKLSNEKNLSFNYYNGKYKNTEIISEKNLNNYFQDETCNQLPRINSLKDENLEFKSDMNNLHYSIFK